MSPSPTAMIAAFILSVILMTFLYVKYGKGDAIIRLPPGPKALPILGNVHQLPLEYQQQTLASWGKIYGDVIFAKFFQTPALVLNSRNAAEDLLEKKSAKYSDRPRFIFMGWDSVLNNLSYGERFRKHRKWIQDAFQAKPALMSYRPLQRRETYTLLLGLMNRPADVQEHLRRWAAAMIMEITYGHRVTSLHDKKPRLDLVDFFPILKNLPTWMPGAGFKRQAFEVRRLVRTLLDTPFEMVKDAMLAGVALPSFTATLLEEALTIGGPSAAEEEDIKGAAGVVYAAGTDTTVTALSTFVLAMVLHPKIYQKAREEIDRVVGHGRLPDFDDRESLPYLECVIKEVFRWNCPVPLGVPHRLMSVDNYRGYEIPAGSMIIPNIWGMMQDAELYPEPVFGFGRRICPGQEFAYSSIWLAAASIIATLDICKSRDEFGNEVTPAASFISGFVSHPTPFTCEFRPRSEETYDLVAQMSAHLDY
ncbi:O-methylsterigmatocystin oxidoreductase [Grifola frondosa]|uniref:O-methylsterigmatocystin oxidoreductase n=1 Tax=Grifola frondosa TaxID=5627 RepID=A0A1C7MC95_GRIFR|nr:O-methylsterigmatocystin oxidoreductase [Grifola frondosa]